MPRKATVDDMVDGIRAVGRPCTKQDIADEVGVTRQTIANHADELENDPRIDHGKVGTAQAYWLREWADSQPEGEVEGGGGSVEEARVAYSEEGSYELRDEDEGGTPEAQMGEPMLIEYRAPTGKTEFIDEYSPEQADIIRKHAAKNDLSTEEAFEDLVDRGAENMGVGPYSKTVLEKIASPQVMAGSFVLMGGGVLVMWMATFAQSTPLLAFSLIMGTLMIAFAAVLVVFAALAQVALARPLRGLIGLGIGEGARHE